MDGGNQSDCNANGFVFRGYKSVDMGTLGAEGIATFHTLNKARRLEVSVHVESWQKSLSQNLCITTFTLSYR